MLLLGVQEVSILKSLNYDRNIVQFYGATLQPGRDLMLVTELMEGAANCTQSSDTAAHCRDHTSCLSSAAALMPAIVMCNDTALCKPPGALVTAWVVTPIAVGARERLKALSHTSPGGDLRAALDKDGRRELVWDRRGQSVALDIARGLHFLHSHGVSIRSSASIPLMLCDVTGPHPADAAIPAQMWWQRVLLTAAARSSAVLCALKYDLAK